MPKDQPIVSVEPRDDAFAKEVQAYENMKAIPGMKPFVVPAGAATTFPDFGFRIKIQGLNVDLHIEYKAEASAQMGSLRKWVYKNGRFSSSTPDDDALILSVMNKSATCKSNARRLIDDFSEAFGTPFKEISRGMLNSISDKYERAISIAKLYELTDDFVLARISDKTLGQGFIDHYKGKFSPREDADVSFLMLMVGSKLCIIEVVGTPEDIDIAKAGLAKKFKVAEIPEIETPVAGLEVRIQPRHVSTFMDVVKSKGLAAAKKQVRTLVTTAPSIDVMAVYRLKRFTQGVEI